MFWDQVKDLRSNKLVLMFPKGVNLPKNAFSRLIKFKDVENTLLLKQKAQFEHLMLANLL